MNLSEPRDGGSSSSCLVVWADDGILAISVFLVCTFQHLDRIIGDNDFYITSYSITTK